MAYSVILHLVGEASVLGEIEELPKPADTIITLTNPRLRDGKDIHYLEQNVVKVIWPLAKVTLIEVLESEEEENCGREEHGHRCAFHQRTQQEGYSEHCQKIKDGECDSQGPQGRSLGRNRGHRAGQGYECNRCDG